MHRLISFAPNITSTARYLARPNYVRISKLLIRAGYRATQTTYIACSLAARSSSVGSCWICFLFCSRNYASLTAFGPALCLPDLSLAAWHIWLAQLSRVLYTSSLRKTPPHQAILLDLRQYSNESEQAAQSRSSWMRWDLYDSFQYPFYSRFPTALFGQLCDDVRESFLWELEYSFFRAWAVCHLLRWFILCFPGHWSFCKAGDFVIKFGDSFKRVFSNGRISEVWMSAASLAVLDDCDSANAAY